MKKISMVCIFLICLVCSCAVPKYDEIGDDFLNEQNFQTTASFEDEETDKNEEDGIPDETNFKTKENQHVSTTEYVIELNDENIIGFWQDFPVVAAGLGDCYYFFGNGNFQFNYSEFDSEKRIVSLFGSWELNENNLTLTVTEKELIEGGWLVPAEPYMISDYQIEGGVYATVQLIEPETYEYLLSEITIDNETSYDAATGTGRKTMYIGDVQYWKFNDTAEKHGLYDD